MDSSRMERLGNMILASYHELNQPRPSFYVLKDLLQMCQGECEALHSQVTDCHEDNRARWRWMHRKIEIARKVCGRVDA